MVKRDKVLDKIVRGTSDTNIAFADLCRLLILLGFDAGIRGDHHIFTKHGVPEILNLQPKGSQAKPYQVEQARSVIVKYKLAGEDND